MCGEIGRPRIGVSRRRISAKMDRVRIARPDWRSSHAPWRLLQTGVRVAASTILGDQLDRRLLRPTPAHDVTDFSHREQLVLDFVSDSGDGWSTLRRIV